MWYYETTRTPVSVATHTYSSAQSMNSTSSQTSSGTAGGITSTRTQTITVESRVSFTQNSTFYGTAAGFWTTVGGTVSFTVFQRWDNIRMSSVLVSSLAITAGTSVQQSNATATDFITTSLNSTALYTESYTYNETGFSRYTTRASTVVQYTTIVNTVVGTSTNSAIGTTFQTFSTSGSNSQSFLLQTSTSTTSTTRVDTVTTLGSRSFKTFTTSAVGTVTVTTSGSSSYSATVTTTTNHSVSTSKALLTTFTGYPMVDRIMFFDSTDWAWEFTTTGTGQITDLATRITETAKTYQQAAYAATISTWTPVTVTWSSRQNNTGFTQPAGTTFRGTFWNTVNQTKATTTRTHTTTTYAIGATDGGADRTITRTYSTSRATTISYHSISSRTVNAGGPGSYLAPLYFTVSYDYTYIETQTNEPITYTKTFLNEIYWDSNSADYAEEQFSSTGTGTNFSRQVFSAGTTSQNGFIERNTPDQETPGGGDTFYKVNQRTYSVGNTVVLSHDLPAVAGGFQSVGSVGGTYGTNIAIAGSVSYGAAFPLIAQPIINPEDTRTYSVAGTVNNTLRRADSTGAIIGGNGWSRSSTDRSQVTASTGFYRFTSQDSAGGQTVGYTTMDVLTASTVDVSNGNMLRFETVPKMAANITEAYDFPAFPVTNFPALVFTG